MTQDKGHVTLIAMRKAFTYVLLAASLVLAYQAWQNSRLTSETEALSREAVCESGCGVLRDRPNFTRTDPLRRRYEWRTTDGQKTATCTRELVFFGAWSCAAEEGAMGRF